MRFAILSLAFAITLALVDVAGCTIGAAATPPGEGEGEGEGSGTFCDVQNMFAANCTVCHGAAPSVSTPDLTDVAALIGADSTLYPGHTFVVAGDPQSSLLFVKVNGVPADGSLGVLMPQGSHLSAAQIASLSTWIQNGADTTCGSPPPPTEIVPGGDVSGHISTGGVGYGTTPPSFIPPGGACSTSSWWQPNPGEGDHMYPGGACIQCHTQSGDGPIFTYAGTVQASLHDEDTCRGVGDVLVEILDDASGSTVASQTTDSQSGNFGLAIANPPSKYRVRLTLDGRTREMVTAQTVGDCESCHTVAGDQSAPGRIVAP